MIPVVFSKFLTITVKNCRFLDDTLGLKERNDNHQKFNNGTCLLGTTLQTFKLFSLIPHYQSFTHT